jgi:hypothetical protein
VQVDLDGGSDGGVSQGGGGGYGDARGVRERGRERERVCGRERAAGINQRGVTRSASSTEWLSLCVVACFERLAAIVAGVKGGTDGFSQPVER